MGRGLIQRWQVSLAFHLDNLQMFRMALGVEEGDRNIESICSFLTTFILVSVGKDACFWITITACMVVISPYTMLQLLEGPPTLNSEAGSLPSTWDI